MTYKAMKNLLNAYLIGDNVIPTENDIVIELLRTALLETATRADSMHLTVPFTFVGNVLRLHKGDYVIRMPLVPVDDADEIDIDEELMPVVARLMARDISKEKGPIHEAAADRLILDYNAKIYNTVNAMEAAAECAGMAIPTTPCSVTAALDANDDTEWQGGE